MHEGFDRGCCLAIHHFQTGRNDARGDDRGDRIAGLDHIVERGHDHLRELRLGHELERDLGDDDEQAFGADRERKQIESRPIERRAAEGDRFALDRVAAQTEYVVNREAVLEAVHAAGILRDIAADRARDLRGRIGGVVQTERCRRLGDGEIAHARLDARDAGDGIDVEDTAEFRQRQHEPVRARHRAARQAGARAARDHRNAQAVAGAQDFAHLRFGFGQGDGERRLPERGEAVAFEGRGFFCALQQTRGGQDARKRRGQRVLTLVGLGGGCDRLAVALMPPS